jgi:NAD(P)-dependent dehydrogenase (short-subunit alcohol dehydrogenase family)
MFGFGNAFNPDTDIPDLSGKTILVTGGNSGLGKESVRQFAKHKSKVYMGARSEEKAAAAIADIKKQVPDADITFLELDLASLESVKSAARTFLSTNDRLDILMNNGGIMAVPPGLTADGYELQFGTNHLGHAGLAKLLMPVLLKTAAEPGSDVRIINLTSVAQQAFAPSEGLLLDQAKTKMEAVGVWGRYGHSKLANVYFTKGLVKHYPQLKSVATHPGGVNTNLPNTVASNLPYVVRAIGSVLMGLFLASVAEGARNQLWASTAKREEVISGAVYYPVAKEHKGRPLMNDMKKVDLLWDWTEKELATHGF